MVHCDLSTSNTVVSGAKLNVFFLPELATSMHHHRLYCITIKLVQQSIPYPNQQSSCQTVMLKCGNSQAVRHHKHHNCSLEAVLSSSHYQMLFAFYFNLS